MRLLAVLALLLAGCPPPPAPPPRWSPDDAAPPLVDPVRKETLAAEKPVDGIEIEGVPTGYVSWTIAIRNNTDSPIDVVWDESSFVSASGESQGRLIRGQTRKMDVANSQPPTPLPPHVRITQTVLAEHLAELEEDQAKEEQEYNRSRLHVTYDYGLTLRKPLIDRRKKEHRALLGAHVYMAIKIAGEMKLWSGVVREPAKAQEGSGSAVGGADALAKPDE